MTRGEWSLVVLAAFLCGLGLGLVAFARAIVDDGTTPTFHS